MVLSTPQGATLLLHRTVVLLRWCAISIHIHTFMKPPRLSNGAHIRRPRVDINNRSIFGQLNSYIQLHTPHYLFLPNPSPVRRPLIVIITAARVEVKCGGS